MTDQQPVQEPSRDQARSSLRWALSAAMVLILGAGAFVLLQRLAPVPADQPPRQAPLAEFAVVTPVGETLSVTAEGVVRAAAEVALVSEVSGRITEVAEGLVSGGRFDQGDLLVRIDDAPFRVDLAEARAAVKRAEAELEDARNQVDRVSRLAARDFNAEAQLEDARVNRRRAQSALEQAQAAVERARIRLDDARIRAPFDSRVLTENVAVGQFLAPGQEVARLFATGTGEVRVGLSRDDAGALVAARGGGGPDRLVGMEARVNSALGPDTTSRLGRVDRVVPAVERAARTIELVVRVDDAFSATPDRPPLLLDDLVTVNFAVPGRPGWWKLPATALKQPGQLWRLSADDTLEPVPVAVVLRSGNHAVVASEDLQKGDRVLLTDLRAPVAGLAVRPREAAPQ